MTQGRAAYSMVFSHYEKVPKHVAEAIAGQRKEQANARS
jgi:translation elongation factor EF-G